MKCCYMDKECDKDCIAYNLKIYEKCIRLENTKNIHEQLAGIYDNLNELNDNIKELKNVIKKKD